jgi:ankyrin repeat protein
MVALLLEAGARESAAAVLHDVIVLGDGKAAQILLDAGVSPNAPRTRDSSNATPLDTAATHGCAAIARMLLLAAADPNAVRSDNNEVGSVWFTCPANGTTRRPDLKLAFALQLLTSWCAHERLPALSG